MSLHGAIGHFARPVKQPAKARTSSVKLATANGTSRKLSSVTDGRNGAMIQPSSSAIMPIGAKCTCPARFIVETIVSRIIGIGLPLSCAQGLPGLGQAAEIFRRTIGGASPIERRVLRVALAETPSDFRLHQFGAKVEGVRAVVFDVQLGEQRHRGLCNAMHLAIEDVDTVLRDFDTEIGIPDLAGELGNFAQ